MKIQQKGVIKATNRQTVDLMLQVETTNSSGSTPLHVAAYYGSGDMLNLLLHCGADQTHRNKVRQTRDT